jgi:hypothetical protein
MNTCTAEGMVSSFLLQALPRIFSRQVNPWIISTGRTRCQGDEESFGVFIRTYWPMDI